MDIKLVLVSCCLTCFGRKGKSRKEEEWMRYKKENDYAYLNFFFLEYYLVGGIQFERSLRCFQQLCLKYVEVI